MENEIHPERTTGKRKAQYMFTAKHHGGAGAQWAVSRDKEFSVFNGADVHDLADEAGNLYGILPSEDGGLCYLGTCAEQVAKFPCAKEPTPWHGYPLFPVNDRAPENRRGEKCQPDVAVFKKMEQAGLLGPGARKRLQSGRHVKKGRLA